MSHYFETVELVGPLDKCYEIDDSKTDEWELFKNDFIDTLERKFGIDLKSDLEVAEWHHQVMRVWSYVYTERLYTSDFIAEVLNILSRHGHCVASFECYDDKKLLSTINVFPDAKVEIDDAAVESGLAERLGFSREG